MPLTLGQKQTINAAIGYLLEDIANTPAELEEQAKLFRAAFSLKLNESHANQPAYDLQKFVANPNSHLQALIPDTAIAPTPITHGEIRIEILRQTRQAFTKAAAALGLESYDFKSLPLFAQFRLQTTIFEPRRIADAGTSSRDFPNPDNRIYTAEIDWNARPLLTLKTTVQTTPPTEPSIVKFISVPIIDSVEADKKFEQNALQAAVIRAEKEAAKIVLMQLNRYDITCEEKLPAEFQVEDPEPIISSGEALFTIPLYYRMLKKQPFIYDIFIKLNKDNQILLQEKSIQTLFMNGYDIFSILSFRLSKFDLAMLSVSDYMNKLIKKEIILSDIKVSPDECKRATTPNVINLVKHGVISLSQAKQMSNRMYQLVCNPFYYQKLITGELQYELLNRLKKKAINNCLHPRVIELANHHLFLLPILRNLNKHGRALLRDTFYLEFFTQHPQHVEFIIHTNSAVRKLLLLPHTKEFFRHNPNAFGHCMNVATHPQIAKLIAHKMVGAQDLIAISPRTFDYINKNNEIAAHLTLATLSLADLNNIVANENDHQSALVKIHTAILQRRLGALYQLFPCTLPNDDEKDNFDKLLADFSRIAKAIHFPTLILFDRVVSGVLVDIKLAIEREQSNHQDELYAQIVNEIRLASNHQISWSVALNAIVGLARAKKQAQHLQTQPDHDNALTRCLSGLFSPKRSKPNVESIEKFCARILAMSSSTAEEKCEAIIATPTLPQQSSSPVSVSPIRFHYRTHSNQSNTPQENILDELAPFECRPY